MSRTLLEISEELEELEQLLEEVQGDLTDPRVESATEEWFDNLNVEADDKIDNYAALIRELEMRSEVRKQEATRLRDRSRMDQEKAAFLKGRLYTFFNRHGLRKKETNRFRISIAKHGGKLPVEIDIPAESLDNQFQKITIDYDKTALREALEMGREIFGVRFGERGESLRIK